MVTSLPVLLNTLLYAAVGIVVFVVGFVILDLLTPGKLWEEIREKQNLAVAIFAGAGALGLAIIVAAAIHG
jgi:putative membrane protein